MRHHLGYFVIVLCLALVLLGWIGHARQDDFRDFHLASARDSASIAAVEIARFVDEKKRLVNLFAQDHRALIESLAVDGAVDGAPYRRLSARIGSYFPEHFAFAVTDGDGGLLVEDFDSLIGDLCLADLQAFLVSRHQQPRIHPHTEAYHFDVLAPLPKANDAAEIFFISFHADILGRVLKATQPSGHGLILVYPEQDDLIEVTASGARINWVRDDYRLAPDEKKRILHREPVPGTRWEVVDLHEPDLFVGYTRSLLTQSGIIFVAFMLVNVIMLFYLHREEELRRSAEARIRQMAFYDELTGLANRRLLKDRLDRAMAHCTRTRRYAALMFLDLDNFKALNDEHGHEMGDLLLKEVARRIQGRLRADDTVARFGGDEFVVLIEALDGERDAAAAKVRQVAESLRVALAEPYALCRRLDAEHEVKLEHPCTVSIGAVLFTGESAGKEDVLKWADAAMYRAKQTGRNSIWLNDDRPTAPATTAAF